MLAAYRETVYTVHVAIQGFKCKDIRVNDQFRICFVWTDTGPTDVEITNHSA